VFCKELLDALRDRRTLVMVLLSSMAMGPVVLLLISSLASTFEKRAEAREVVVAGIAHAPGLRNYLERQHHMVKEAPADYEAQLKDSRLQDPVLVVPAGFDRALLAGEVPVLEVVSHSANQRAQAGVGPDARLQPGAGGAALAGARRVASLAAGGGGGRGGPGQPRLARRAVGVHAALLRADGSALWRPQCRAGHHGR
jgi:ABC-type Na+ efflux pump permease subunit